VWLASKVDDVRVDLRSCVRCAACAIVAPQTFEITRKGTRIVRQPEDDRERAACRVAALVCPTRAIQT
jgi:ferredoxin